MIKVISGLLNANERELRKLRPLVEAVNSWEPAVMGLSDDQLKSKTAEFRERIARGESPDSVLPEAFAVVRETARRTLDMRPFDVQVMGGIVLHQGRIAEMQTGEGKTLVATMPAYLNAVAGRTVHVVTVNDYLARRDREWMGQVYRFLGLDVGLVIPGMTTEAKKASYKCPIIYGTNTEFGFDYLRDHMCWRKEDMVQGVLDYAIIDEVDSILIDEARTPLIISGEASGTEEVYRKFARLASLMKRDQHYTVEEKTRVVDLTDEGRAFAERWLGIEDLNAAVDMSQLFASTSRMRGGRGNADLDSREEISQEHVRGQYGSPDHYLRQAIRAKELMKRDVDYIVKDGEVLIVDEFTGRILYGRRFSDGLHQAIEAKEGVPCRVEAQTLATITVQNFFRMYKKLAGMTGTAMTEEAEFIEIYGLDVVSIPTNRPLIRTNYPDSIWKTERAKFKAVVEEIRECHKKGRPVLVGTISIEKSEKLSELLKKEGIPHQVLNAKHHEREAEIVAQAGRIGAVTIATNMAGRGTDILLGGNPAFLAKEKLRQKGYPPEVIQVASEYVLPEEVRRQIESGNPDEFAKQVVEARELYSRYYREAKEITDAEHDQVVRLGGLHVIGTERHEARRIDNQLRGRAGRQGDPGSSRFYLSLEDDLMRLFGGDQISGLMERLGFEEDEPIEHPIVTRAVETAQKRLESHNFSIRKSVLEYDNVLNKQRETVYRDRTKVLETENLSEMVLGMAKRCIERAAGTYLSPLTGEEADVQGFLAYVSELCPEISPGDPRFSAIPEILGRRGNKTLVEDVTERVFSAVKEVYLEKSRGLGENMKLLERLVLLRVIDSKWVDHLTAMEILREGIGLRAYGQKDPLVEYQMEAFELFNRMVQSIEEDVVRYIFRMTVRQRSEGQVPAGGGRGAYREMGRARTGSLEDREGREQAGVTSGRGPQRARDAKTAGPVVRGTKKVGRNDPCPCGSGKKYKNCCGKL